MTRSNRLLALGFGFGAVLLANAFVTPARADDKEKKVKELDRTPVNCVTLNAIRTKTGIDKQTVLLTMKGDKFYRVDLPSACANLDPGDTQLIFVYDSKGSQKLARLCSYDSFGVEHKTGPGCPLAKFNPVTAEEAAALLAKTEGK